MPPEYVAPVIRDFQSRRGRMQEPVTTSDAAVLRGAVPLANMFGYTNALRSLSQGHARFTMQFHHHAPLPPPDDDPPFPAAARMSS